MGGIRQPRRPTQTQNRSNFDPETSPITARSPRQNGSSADWDIAQLRSQLDEIREWLEVVLEETLGELDGQSVLIPGHRLLELKAILEEENKE